MDCLVTKLKGVVSDTNLLPLGAMILHVSKQEDDSNNQMFELHIQTTEAQEIKVINGDSNLTLDSTMSSGWKNQFAVNSGYDNVFYCKNGNYDLLITNKYAITRLGKRDSNVDSRAISFDIDSLKYSKDLECIAQKPLVNLSGALSSLEGKTFGFLYLSGSEVTGDINTLNNIGVKTIDGICVINLQNLSNVTGNISSLTKSYDAAKILDLRNNGFQVNVEDVQRLFPNITELNIIGRNVSGSIDNFNLPVTIFRNFTTRITGSIENMVKAQRAAGRTTGTIDAGGDWASDISFNGGKSLNGILSWTETQITLGETTITA